MGIGSIQIGRWNQTQNLSKSVWQWPFCVSRQSFRVTSVITDPKTSRWLIITPYNCPKSDYRYLSWVHIITQSLSCSFKWRHRCLCFAWMETKFLYNFRTCQWHVSENSALDTLLLPRWSLQWWLCAREPSGRGVSICLANCTYHNILRINFIISWPRHISELQNKPVEI